MFKVEQDIYRQEGINWKQCKYVDNQKTIEMIDHDKNTSVFKLLDEQFVRREAGNDRDLFESIYGRLHPTNQKAIYAPPHDRHSAEKFTIMHFAGEVTYTVTDFVEKNKDSQSNTINQTLAASKNPIIALLYGSKTQATGQKMQGNTLSRQFKSQLNELVQTLSLSEPRYVRCIKPNNNYSAVEF